MLKNLRCITWRLCVKRLHLNGLISKKQVKRIEWKIKNTLARNCQGIKEVEKNKIEVVHSHNETK